MKRAPCVDCGIDIDSFGALLLPLAQVRSLAGAVREVLDLIVGRSGDFYLCVAPVGENPSNMTDRRIA
jgi:hypothetical protein